MLACQFQKIENWERFWNSEVEAAHKELKSKHFPTRDYNSTLSSKFLIFLSINIIHNTATLLHLHWVPIFPATLFNRPQAKGQDTNWI